MRKYGQIVVLESTWCEQSWRKRQAAVGTGSLWERSVASMVVESSRILFFCVSSNRVTDRVQRNFLEEAL